jgi:hypothetical protein
VDTAGDAVLDAAAAVAGGLRLAATAADDPTLVRRGTRRYRRVRACVDPVVRTAGAVLVAFPSRMRAPRSGPCLVVVLPGAILVACRSGRVRPVAETVVIEKAGISRVELASSGAGRALLACVEGRQPRCVFGVPRGLRIFGAGLP